MDRRLWPLFAVFLAFALLSVLPSVQAQNPPDLAVTGLAFEPAEPGRNETVNLTSEITNRGGTTTCQFWAQFRIDGVGGTDRNSTDNQAPLSNGDTTTVTIVDGWTTEPSSTTLNVSIGGCPGDGNPANDGRNVTVDLGPDLQITGIGLDPAQPEDGDEVTIEVDVLNAGPWNTSLPFDVEASVAGTTLDAQAEVLGPGNTTTVTVGTWTATPGTHNLTAQVDPLDAVDEFDETNNAHDGPTLDIAPKDPDLSVSAIVAHPIAPAPGDQVAIQANVENLGDEAAPATTTRLMIDGTLHPPNNTTSAIDPDSQEQSLWLWNATIGAHELTVLADAGDDVNESDETNNALNRTLLVGPDLAVTGLRLSPDDVAAGENVTLETHVVNEGRTVDADVTVVVTVDGSPVNTTVLDGLETGANETLTVGPIEAVPGTHTVQVTVDPDAAIPEARETNNQAQRTLTVAAGRPNLVVADAGLNRSQAAPGDPVAFEAVIRNTGANGSASFDVVFAVDGSRLGDPIASESLASGSSTTVNSSNWTAQAGSHTLTVEIHTGGDGVPESDEADNRFRLPFSIGPELVGLEITLDPAEPRVGEQVTIVGRIANAGTQPAGPFQLRLAVDGDPIAEATPDGLDPGTETEINHTWRATADAETILLTADVRDEVDEVNETNNEIARELQVDTDVADLALRNLTADPPAPAPGTNVTFNVTVANEGVAASGAFTVVFRVNGTPLDELDVADLAPGEEVVLQSSSWVAELGDTNVTAVADPSDAVPESSLGNNEATLAVQVEEDGFRIPGPGALAALATGIATSILAGRASLQRS